MSTKQQNKLTKWVKRFLDVMRMFFLIVAVIWPITVMVVGLSIPSDPEQRHTDVSVFSNYKIHSELIAENAGSSGNRSELVMSGKGNVLLNNTKSRMSWYLSGAISEVLLFVFLFGLLTLRSLFVSLNEGSTFTEQNAQRLTKVGYVLIGFHIISPILQYVGSRIMLNDIALNVPGVSLYPGFELNVGGLFAGAAIIVLSGVLREATSIHQEQELTI